MTNGSFLRHSQTLASLFALHLACACSAANPSERVPAEPEGELTATQCASSVECNDGAFCNGTETCDEGFCRLGVTPRCDDGIECTRDVCSHKTSSCQFIPPDEDGDGHADGNCTGPGDESLGDDCDDEDPNRFPGNEELCQPDEPAHDEDCDPKSFGYQDNDADGEVADTCCNEGDDGQAACGTDCDDDDYRRNHDYPEICDELDNDCDGKVDKNTKEVLWYLDTDGDHFGVESDDAILSCAPILNRSLRSTDCDDAESAVHIAAREECDGVDNDCNGETDEDGVCACAPQGNVRPCSCGGSLTGVQLCDSGLWNACDCEECVTGSTDCVGELLPRECIAGRWQVQPTCRGIRPICLEGSCMCADGSDECSAVPDVLRPYVKDTFPSDGSGDSHPGINLAVEFNEEIASASASGAFTLTTSLGVVVPGTMSVGGRTLYFVPEAPLGAGQSYQFQVNSTVTDLAGNALQLQAPVHFRIASGLTPTRVYDDALRNFTSPLLAMNEAGEAMLVCTNTSRPELSGYPTVKSTAYWNGTKFVPGIVVSYQTTEFSAAFDDQSHFLFGQQIGDHSLHYFTAGIHSKTDYPSQNATFNTQVFANSAGDAMVVLPNQAGLYVASGTTTDIEPSPQFLEAASYLYEVAGDINAAGRGIVAAYNGGETHAFLSDANRENWQEAALDGGPNSPLSSISNIQVVLGSDNVATFAWVHRVIVSQNSIPQVFTQELGSDGEWIGAPVQPSGTLNSTTERTPQLASDGAGNLMLSYSRGSQMFATRRPAGGSWSAETVFNPPSNFEIEASALKMAQSGEAVLAFVTRSSVPNTTDLWVARYSPGTGWTPARLVEDEVAQIIQFDVGIDGAGNVLVVYTTSIADAVWVKL